MRIFVFPVAIIYSILMILLPSCTHNRMPQLRKAPPKPPIKVQIITQEKAFPPFTSIDIQGNLNIILKTSRAQSSVALKGSARDLDKVTVQVLGSRLYVVNKNQANASAIFVTINTQNLYAFHYIGQGIINGSKINANFEDLFISNNDTTHLSGNITLHNITTRGAGLVEINGVKTRFLNINMTKRTHLHLNGNTHLASLNIRGTGALALNWINSERLTIRARDNVTMHLAGRVNILDLETTDHVRFNGRYLRAHSTFVKTYGHSVASITTLDKQHALASDASDIYFYNIPTLKTNYMAYEGAVLDMRDWHNFIMKDYNRYNK